MNFDAGLLKQFLSIMREHGVDSGKLDNFEFKFGVDTLPRTPLLPETQEERLDKLKQALLEANKEADDVENWST